MTARADPAAGAAWNRVRSARPMLRRHTAFQRHEVRGQLWYVLRDAASNRHYRLSPAAYLAAGLMDGERTVEEIRQVVERRLGEDEALGPDELVRLLAQLHAADALRGGEAPDLDELWRRGAASDARRVMMQLRSPLAIRIPLLDPDRVLDHLAWLGRALFSPLGALAWLCLVGFALAQLGSHWDELTGNLVDRVLSVGNLAILVVVFPVLKALHEIGHGLAVKRWGGEVHETGIMLLVFMPVPYVDASAASFFAQRWRRVVVGAAGMYVEIALAAIAFLIWRDLEPGLVRSALFNAMLIGGVSTVLFNGNPLLRFDGYFILADLISIPNLGPRGNRYVGYLLKRYCFALRKTPSPAIAEGEAPWMLSYAVLSFVYRMMVLAVIVLFVAQKFFFIGVAIALWSCVMVIVKPIAGMLHWLVFSPELSGRRRRALALSGLTAGLAGVLLFAVPAPLATTTEGVVWAAEEEELSFAVDGFVSEVSAHDGAEVCAGCPIARLEHPELAVRLRVLEAQLEALTIKRQAELLSDRVQAGITLFEIEHVREQLAQAHFRRDSSILTGPVAGPVLLINDRDLVGSYVQRGELIGYAFGSDDLIVRGVVRQGDIGLVRAGVQAVEVVPADNTWRVFEGRLARITPAAVRLLPSMALSDMGGGPIAIDPQSNPDQPQTLEDVYEIEIALPSRPRMIRLGQRAHIKLVHGTEPLAFQWWRRARQLFLDRFNV